MIEVKLPNGMTIYGLRKTNTIELYREIFELDTYGRTGLKLKDGDTIFDVGANVGMFTLWVIQNIACADVFCFEPCKNPFTALSANIAKYGDFGLGVITLNNAAIGHYCGGRTPITYYPRLCELSTLDQFAYEDVQQETWLKYILRYMDELKRFGWLARSLPKWIKLPIAKFVCSWLFKQKQEICHITTISEMIRRYDIQQIDLLKVDVEKSELYVLLGINDEDWPKIKQLAVECDGGAKGVGQITKLLMSKGYETKLFSNLHFKELEVPIVAAWRN